MSQMCPELTKFLPYSEGWMRPRGKAALIEHLSAFSFPAFPRGPWLSDRTSRDSRKSYNTEVFYQYCLALGSHLAAPQDPSCCASKPQVCRASKPLGTNFESKFFKFRWLLGPSDQNELYHTPLLSKI